MSGKIIVSAVSLILVVGVVIGAVVVVHNKNTDPQVTERQHAVKAMCQNTEDQKLCHDTLGSVRNSSDPKAFIAAALEATTNNVIKALNMSDKLSVEQGNSSQGIVKMALDDCKDLLQFAMDSLQASTDFLGSNSVQSLSDRSPDFKNWLASVVSYQQACMDGYDENVDGAQQIKSQLQENGLDNVGKLTGIALDIMADLESILNQFGLKVQVNPASRRLLEVDSEGYPTWFSAADRKLLANVARGRGHHIKPNVVVAQDGSGQFKTIMAAVNSYPKGFKGRYIIQVKAGTYREYVVIPKTAVNILMYGEGTDKTIVTGNRNNVDGYTTSNSATFVNTANGFIGKYMTFMNTAGPEKHQAVAFRNQGDMSAMFDCSFVGFQDTLYAQSNRQFYRNCDISGTVDFIFGMSTTLIQSSRIIVRKPMDNQFNTVTADGTSEKNAPTGTVIQNCDIAPESALFPVRFKIRSYLGRPWKQYARTVVMESRIADFIQADGWTPWSGSIYLNTLYYAEYNNEGPGANVAKRVKWPGYKGLISKAEATQFTAGQFLRGGPTSRAEDWMKPLHVPFDIGFTKP
ncbi:pectinesterase-like [Neltuma alba]|uniref:pectinesterase-like n=1 Tax=Neltuma alba TaxID=207710 RepID=UPI0010A4F3E3|nr:pectinesterase-like [Prosopis alba]